MVCNVYPGVYVSAKWVTIDLHTCLIVIRYQAFINSIRYVDRQCEFLPMTSEVCHDFKTDKQLTNLANPTMQLSYIAQYTI